MSKIGLVLKLLLCFSIGTMVSAFEASAKESSPKKMSIREKLKAARQQEQGQKKTRNATSYNKGAVEANKKMSQFHQEIKQRAWEREQDKLESMSEYDRKMYNKRELLKESIFKKSE